MDGDSSNFRASALTLYMNHQPCKEHPGCELRVTRDAAGALQGRTSPGPMAEGRQRWPKQHKTPAGDPERKHSYGLCSCSCVSPSMHVEATRGWLCTLLCAAPAAELSQPQNWAGGVPTTHSGDRPERTSLTAPRKGLTQPGRLKRWM